MVEALFRSGTSVTARIALENNKKVFALPGSLDSTYSYGTNNLIRNGAYLVMEAEDIFLQFPNFLNKKKINVEKNQTYGNSEFEEIYKVLSDVPISIDKIALMTNKDIKEVIGIITLMELEDLISHEIGRGYKRKEE